MMHILSYFLIGLFEVSSGLMIAVFLNGDTPSFWRGALLPIVAIWLVVIGPLCVFGALSLTIALAASYAVASGKIIVINAKRR